MQIRYSIPLLFLLLCLNACEDPEPLRPNFILIMVDDMGYSDLSCFGSRIETPHIDRLAAHGLVFPSFYNTSRCCPSRAALLTGLYQHQAGVGDMTADLGIPEYQGYLNRKCRTLAEALSQAGYQTLMSGKWHLGSRKEQWPGRRGFQQFFGIPEGGGVYFYPFAKPRQVVFNDSILQPDSSFYSTTAFNNYALGFVEEALEKEEPFFLYLAHIAPHFPLQAPAERYRKYLGLHMEDFQVLRRERLEHMISKGFLDPGTTLSKPDSLVLDWSSLSRPQKEELDLQMAIYAAQLEMVDEGVGELLKLLERREALDHTLILFLSDNGGCHEEQATRQRFASWDGDLGKLDSYRCYARSWAHVSNTPFSMYKHWEHEGGISSPLILHWPEGIEEPGINHAVLHIMDVMPTLLELAGAAFPEEDGFLPLEGQSFVPLIQGDSLWERGPLFWEHEGNRAARAANWKIVSSWPENRWRLYDMAVDRAEKHDLSFSYPDIKDSLINSYNIWAKRCGVLPWDVVREIKNP